MHWLPSDEEAMKIAQNFLAERGLLPEGYQAYSAKPGDSAGKNITTLLVSFRAPIREAGPGGKFGVRVGDEGRVVRLFINPMEIQKLPVLENVDIIPVEQAFEEMKKDVFYDKSSEIRKIEITNVYLAYWLDGIDQVQDYVAPLYVFKGRFLDENGNVLISDSSLTRGMPKEFTSYAQAMK